MAEIIIKINQVTEEDAFTKILKCVDGYYHLIKKVVTISEYTPGDEWINYSIIKLGNDVTLNDANELCKELNKLQEVKSLGLVEIEKMEVGVNGL